MTKPKIKSKLNEHQICMLLEDRFSDHACFRQFRTITGYGDARYVDLIAVGMWNKNWGIKAFEIKVNRQDFFSDVAQFEKKHEDALSISNEFYYVTPHLLIDRSEVPTAAGLFQVMKNGTGLRKIKQAPYAKRETLPLPYFMAFAREFGNKIYRTKIPVKYLGRELSQEDFLELVEEKKREVFDWDVKEKAQELNKELFTDNEELRQFKSRLRRELGNKDEYPWNKLTDEELLERLAELVNFRLFFERTGEKLKEAQKAIDGAFGLIQKIAKEEE